MADKLTAIKIKQNDETYSDDIPISAKVENIAYNKLYSMKEIIGDIDLSKGNIQEQLNNNNNTIINTTQEWLTNNYADLKVFELYNSNKAYQQGDYVIYKQDDEQNLYVCLEDIATPGEWDSSKWEKINFTIETSPALIDSSLSIKGMAADAQAAGKLITINDQTPGEITKIHFNTTNRISIPTMDDISMLTPPNENGIYNLQVTVNNNTVIYSWNKIS